ncbi:MAG TPA: NAD(P)/FAD-dependent oxidoreductase [Bacillota bacterium]|nr:NAD(P)/FAD-dependent oxidoreductase [Bacillota bacterium]HOL13877.1 NAD(P)/FAD-dependent oxidoreductase [Bacillota bacterium]HPT60463.1 NAD(P)/FAD-dependent oxidoreductase [Bacillota bacterium]
MIDCLIIGAGPAGLMAASALAQNGIKGEIWEKSPKPGLKLLITGKGRCNITNARYASLEDFLQNYNAGGRFLYSALNRFSPQDTMEFFASRGLEVVVEQGGRVFPKSEKARDVLDVQLKAAGPGFPIRTRRAVESINVVQKAGEDRVFQVRSTSGHTQLARCVIVAVGGASYPKTGSTGDGVKLLSPLGHTFTKLRAGLVPLECSDDFITEIQGLSLVNVEASLYVKGKKVFNELGEMVFTHFGVSGPLILSMSNNDFDSAEISIDLKPALDHEKLDKRVQRDFDQYKNRDFKNALDDLLPQKLIPVIVRLSGIDPDRKVHSITRKERQGLVALLKDFRLHVTGKRPIDEAIVTLGGLNLKEIDPRTMESKLVSGLYVCGEMIDVSAVTGGYNLQAAFSTGYLAGHSCACKLLQAVVQ